ncbi:MAG: tetratricopeptide repeat protein [Pseudomonadota bacterium]
MVTRPIYTRLVGVLAALVLGGCAGIDPYARPTPAPGTPPPAVGTEVPAPADAGEPGASSAPDVQPDVAPPPSAPRPGPAAAHLLAEAQALSARRDFDRAAAQVERALRIERDNPWLYLALADIRLAQGENGQAAALTRRARSLSRGDPAVLGEVDALNLRNPDPGVGP